MFDHIQSRPNKQVIGISKNDLRLKFMQLSRRDGFHRPLRPYRHKRRCLDYAVHCSYSPTSRFRLSILRKKLEHCASVSHNGSGAHAARSRRNCLSWETICSKQGETRRRNDETQDKENGAKEEKTPELTLDRFATELEKS